MAATTCWRTSSANFMLSRTITSVEEACALIREGSSFAVWGGGSKGGLRAQTEGAVPLDMRRFAGITEYDPGEFTFTAKAGTMLKDIAKVLAEAGQYLPFDPMLTEPVATLGGCIASGISGPGRFRYGGLRDFIIGIKFIDGRGSLVTGGGKVVKNAAGFDFPKLMVGSCGRLGVITEATFKVFPKPKASLTAMAKLPLLTLANEAVRSLSRLPFDLDALELMPPHEVVIRISGEASALPARLEAISKATNIRWRALSAASANEMWESLTQLSWVDGFTSRVRVPLTTQRVVEMDEFLERHEVSRLYSVGANVAWMAWPPSIPVQVLNDQLLRMKLGGLQLDGAPTRLGMNAASTAEGIVKRVLDPENKFGAQP